VATRCRSIGEERLGRSSQLAGRSPEAGPAIPHHAGGLGLHPESDGSGEGLTAPAARVNGLPGLPQPACFAGGIRIILMNAMTRNDFLKFFRRRRAFHRGHGSKPASQSGPGFTDTPMLPGMPWHVHDPARPHPKVVVPASVPGGPPSDAIVLFDGTDLSHWVQRGRGADTGKMVDPYGSSEPATSKCWATQATC